MAAGRGSGKKRALVNGTSKSISEQTNGFEPVPTQAPTPAAESSTEDGPPPAKRPRLKLNVKPKPPVPSDTIAVSRPRRTLKQNTRYSDSIDANVEPKPAAVKKSAPIPASPALSSDLSSLSSAPASPLSGRSSSPFGDPVPPAEDEYGNDFMSFYVAGGDEAEQAVTQTKTRRKSKVEPAKKSPQAAKTIENTQGTADPLAPSRLRKSSQPHTPNQQQAQILQEQRNQVIPPQALPQQHHHHHIPPQAGQSIRPQNVPSSYPLAPPAPPPRPIPQPPSKMPPPVVNFIEVPHDPKPLQPDTVRIMIQKLEALSNALTNFGGVPAMPTTPPAAQPPQPVKLAKSAKTAKPSQAAKSRDAVDDFLGVFAEVDSSDEEEDADPVDPLAYVLSNGGVPDGPLSYGIQFIQNALRSWAQQRINHSVTQQFQAQQCQQQMHGQQMQQQQKRGPGRPRRYNEPIDPLPNMGAIIHFDMAGTPEGLAIRAFQVVLDSGCLTVNGILPYPLARALRRLYMQIDHLINQGTKDNNNWHCMSYGSQIRAHQVRLDKFKAQQQLNTQPHGIAQNVAQTQMTREQLEHAHAVDLERKRSLQHAAQQPYISQQHLHPLQLRVPPAGNVHAASASNTRSNMPPPTLATTPPGTADDVGRAREQAVSSTAGSLKQGDFGSPIVLDSDTNADEALSQQQQVVKSASTGFTSVTVPQATSQDPSDSVSADTHDSARLEATKIATKPPSDAASASASPAPPLQGVMAPSNFPHQGAIVIDQ